MADDLKAIPTMSGCMIGGTLYVLESDCRATVNAALKLHQPKIAELADTIAAQSARIDAQSEEIERLKVDAENYRWLRDTWFMSDDQLGTLNAIVQIDDADQFDDAILAARTA